MKRNVPTIKDVAVIAGVSISTVSRVLNHADNVGEEIQRRVCTAVKETGYSVNPLASSLKSTKRNQIAIVVPTLRRNYYIDIIKGINQYFYERNIISVVLESGGVLEKEKEIISSLQNLWIDGIVLIPAAYRDNEGYRSYAASLSHLEKSGTKIPVVLLESSSINEALDLVRIDYETAFYEMTEHLLEIGRRKLAYFGNSPDAPLYKLVMKGIKRALEAYGLSTEEIMVKNDNYLILDGYHSAVSLLSENCRPDGIICVNDQVAVGVLSACEERGLEVPQEIALVSYEGLSFSAISTPPLTTMIVPRYKLGETAASLLYERIEGSEKKPQKTILNAHMVVRRSSMNSAKKDLQMRMLESENFAHGF
ncbi:MAG: LacI family transcriptional regulator [Lachnospiraceae bacterium]|jgi:LacI family transcriptional regulator|nr:LacI family transcriptional regulator [Lachnospiraceae bacterium]